MSTIAKAIAALLTQSVVLAAMFWPGLEVDARMIEAVAVVAAPIIVWAIPNRT